MMVLLTAAAPVPPLSSASLDGTARIGPELRAIRLRLSCAMERGRITNLAIEFDLTDAMRLRPAFDTDRIEGPSGLAARVHVAATTGTGRAGIDYGSTGSYGNNGAPDTTFTFSAAFSPGARDRAEVSRLQALMGVLGTGAGQVTVRIDNPARGPALEAIAAQSEVDAAALKAALARCQARP